MEFLIRKSCIYLIMKNKIRYFKESIKLVWRSAPGWTATNIPNSALRSILPLILIWLIKELIDGITAAASEGSGIQNNILWNIIAIVTVWFTDEVVSDLSNLVRKKQAMKLEAYMYNLLHSKAIKLDLINFEHPE